MGKAELTSKKMLVKRLAFSAIVVSMLLATMLAACTKSPATSTSKVGDVTMIRYQPEGICSQVSIDPAGLDRLAQRFAEMIDEGRHQGAQLAIYREGKLVLKLAAGTDVRSGESITFDSLFCIRSSTKALAALVMAMLYERGLFSYDDPVFRYWPEFGRNGKEMITIGQVMSHRAGIPQGLPVPVSQYGNREAVAGAVEELEPRWPPGTANGYHASTYGWVVDELAMRLTGHNIADLLKTEITEPLGVKDVYLGLPESEYSRFCPISVLDETTRERALFSDFVNSYEGIKLPLSWVGGVANAWDLANLFNILALEGAHGGRTFLSKETLTLISMPTNASGEIDRILRWPVSWGLGLILGETPDIYGTPPHPGAVGHAGGGANVVWADPHERLAVAFLCNGMRTGGSEWERYRILGDLVYASLLPLNSLTKE